LINYFIDLNYFLLKYIHNEKMIIKEKIIYGKVDFYESKKGFGHESHSFLDSYKYIIQLDR